MSARYVACHYITVEGDHTQHAVHQVADHLPTDSLLLCILNVLVLDDCRLCHDCHVSSFYTLQQCLLIHADHLWQVSSADVSVDMMQVDTHVHHSACMHQKHLLRFIKSKLRKEPGEVVIFRDGKYLTLQEVFESLQLTGYALQPVPALASRILMKK